MFRPNIPFEVPKLPPPLNIQECPDFTKIMDLHNNAQINISELNGALKEIKNPAILLNPFYLYESIHSSAVENIHTTIESALEDNIVPPKERKEVNKEVSRYRQALITGENNMKKFGLSSRTIKEIHKELKVSRGIPGKFRNNQNKLANQTPGGNREIVYTPPPIPLLNELIGNWENFVHNDKSFFPLIKTAIAHYQFEAIHPFEDGNGRTGRILLVLQMVTEKLLDLPLLFISSYLNQHSKHYKELLLNISKNAQWWEFISFMLKGYSEQALATKDYLQKIKAAKRELKYFLYKKDNLGIAKSNIESVVNHIFSYPITHPAHMKSDTKIHWQTCSKYLNAMLKAGILKCEKSGRYKFYTHSKALRSFTPQDSSKKST